MNDSLLLFGGLALVTVAAPGPTTLLALNHGARHGVAAALPGVAGAVLSDAVLIAAVAAGLGGLLATSATAFELLRWTGVLYLAWLGWRLLRSPDTPPAAGHADVAAAGPARRERPAAVFRRSFTVAVTNPKGYLFFSALLPSFIAPNEPLWPQYALLAAVFAGIDGAVLLAYALAGAAGARRFGSPRALRHLDRASGLTLLVLAGGMALWRRDTP
ncbi:LysE family translocator [Hydrogenophaga sp.]|uniref:LysE family translocator n=1 Tax=Hydrogenophaga sp. TaxID=1904254 RepID=UPI0035AE5FA6